VFKFSILPILVILTIGCSPAQELTVIRPLPEVSPPVQFEAARSLQVGMLASPLSLAIRPNISLVRPAIVDVRVDKTQTVGFVHAVVELRDGLNDTIVREQPVIIEVDLNKFTRADNVSIPGFLDEVKLAAETSLTNRSLVLTNPEMQLSRLSIDQTTGDVISIPTEMLLDVELRADSTTSILELALTGFPQINGTVIWSERILLNIEGADHTTLPLKTTPLPTLVADIREDILAKY